jgi:hypothetical protein
MLRNLSSFAAAAALLTAAASRQAQADTIVSVSINTSSISGEDGGIYFQFDPGLNADPASVNIEDFSVAPPGALDPASPLNFSDGGASGSLDTDDLTIRNTFALNDYGEAVSFGSDITFLVDLNIPKKLTGDSGSEFLVQVTGPDLLTPLLTADPQGNLVTMSYDTTGALSILSTNPDTARVSVISTPEPSVFLPLGSLLALLVLVGRKPQSRFGYSSRSAVSGSSRRAVRTGPSEATKTITVRKTDVNRKVVDRYGLHRTTWSGGSGSEPKLLRGH